MAQTINKKNTDKRKIKIERPMTPEEQAAADKAAEVRNSADRIARQIIDMTRNGLFVTLRFMDVALCQFSYINSDQLAEDMKRVKTIATTGQHMIYDPQYVIEQYMKDKQSLSRDYLHMVLHCVFRHPFVSSGLDRAAWDLACDTAVESIICDLDVRQANTREAQETAAEIDRIKTMMNGRMTAEHLYAWLRSGGAQRKDMEKWRHLFHRDDHGVWWDIAKQIEEEMKRRAEEEKDERVREDEHDAQPDPEDENEDNADGTDDAENDDEAGTDEDGEGEENDEDGDDDASGDGSGEEGEENSEESSEDPEEDDGEEEEESSEEGEEAAEEEPEEAEEDSEEDDGWREEEYEDEYSSVPGQSMERENPDDMADPDSDTHDTGEESNDDGSGGGGAGDDPEQSEDEGSGSGESPEGMSGEASDEGKQDDERRPDSNMSGTAGEGKQDDSPGEDPFGDDENKGSSQNMSGSGGRQQQGTSGGEHSAGTGGGGDGSQSAWEHSSGEATQRGSGDDGERSRMSGSSGNKEQLQPGAEQQKQEAKAEQGTADSGEDEEKAPSYMHSGEEQRELEEKWKEISERMLVDLETSSKEWGDKSDSMLQGIKKINRDKYDYATFLRKFSTLKEDIQINDDEFDYVYYTLGMKRYGNIPLIEPLEYKEVRKIRDFVIAIDTSGSCAGEVVQKFLDKTFSIFMQQENFFRKINLHIIQCDAEIQDVVKITDKTEFEYYIRNLEFKGFGGTDFRPVFEYVNTMIDAGEFDDLKGLIYFTDGNGTYPKRRPPYETAFIFVDDDEFEYQVPSWAMKLVLETSDITEEVLI